MTRSNFCPEIRRCSKTQCNARRNSRTWPELPECAAFHHPVRSRRCRSTTTRDRARDSAGLANKARGRCGPHDPVNFLAVPVSPVLSKKNGRCGPVFQTKVHLAIVNSSLSATPVASTTAPLSPAVPSRPPSQNPCVDKGSTATSSHQRQAASHQARRHRTPALCTGHSEAVRTGHQGGSCDETRPAHQQYRSRSDCRRCTPNPAKASGLARATEGGRLKWRLVSLASTIRRCDLASYEQKSTCIETSASDEVPFEKEGE